MLYAIMVHLVPGIDIFSNMKYFMDRATSAFADHESGGSVADDTEIGDCKVAEETGERKTSDLHALLTRQSMAPRELVELFENLVATGVGPGFDIGQVDKFIEDMLGDSAGGALHAEDLENVREALAEIFEDFKSDHDESSEMSVKLKFRLQLARAALAAIELRGIYCPTDALIDLSCGVVLKFLDERVNAEFAMNGTTTVSCVDGTSLMSATVNTFEVGHPSELETVLLGLVRSLAKDNK
jgi:hypothetical protein